MDKATTSRIDWLDSCKGFAIILVVLGHIIYGCIANGIFLANELVMRCIYNLIYLFHMPLFFVLSGYIFYRNYCADGVSKKRSFALSVINNTYVYILFSIIQWLAIVLVSSGVSQLNSVAETTNHLTSITDLIMIPLRPINLMWYLYVLIFYYLFFYWIESRKINDTAKLTIFALVSIAGNIAALFTDFGGIFDLERFLRNIVFFYLGIYISKYPGTKFLSSSSIPVLAAGSAASAAAVIIFVDTDLRFIPAAGTISAGFISLFFVNIFSNNRTAGNSKILNLCGRFSLEIYLTHWVILSVMRAAFYRLGINSFIMLLITSLLTGIFIPIGCSAIMKKIGIHKLVFRPASYLKDKKTDR